MLINFCRGFSNGSATDFSSLLLMPSVPELVLFERELMSIDTVAVLIFWISKVVSVLGRLSKGCGRFGRHACFLSISAERFGPTEQ